MASINETAYPRYKSSFTQKELDDKNARHLVSKSMRDAAKTKDELADLINVAIEELTRNHWQVSLGEYSFH